MFVKDKIGEYFDPFGIPPIKNEFIQFLNKNCERWCYNTVPIQDIESEKCGEFCVEFIRHRSRGDEYMLFINKFSSCLDKNDTIVKRIHLKVCNH
jgi:hypothetical protein